MKQRLITVYTIRNWHPECSCTALTRWKHENHNRDKIMVLQVGLVNASSNNARAVRRSQHPSSSCSSSRQERGYMYQFLESLWVEHLCSHTKKTVSPSNGTDDYSSAVYTADCCYRCEYAVRLCRQWRQQRHSHSVQLACEQLTAHICIHLSVQRGVFVMARSQ